MPLERNFSISLFTEANTDDSFLNQDRVCFLYSLIEDVSLTSPLNLMCEWRKRLWSTGDGWLVSVLTIYVLLLVSKATWAWRKMNHLSVIDCFYSCPHTPSVIWRRCWYLLVMDNSGSQSSDVSGVCLCSFPGLRSTKWREHSVTCFLSITIRKQMITKLL